MQATESVDYERVRNILQNTITRTEERFEMGLLRRYDNFQLPNSLLTAFKRMLCLKKKKGANTQVFGKGYAKMFAVLYFTL